MVLAWCQVWSEYPDLPRPQFILRYMQMTMNYEYEAMWRLLYLVQTSFNQVNLFFWEFLLRVPGILNFWRMSSLEILFLCLLIWVNFFLSFVFLSVFCPFFLYFWVLCFLDFRESLSIWPCFWLTIFACLLWDDCESFLLFWSDSLPMSLDFSSVSTALCLSLWEDIFLSTFLLSSVW